MIVVTTQDIPNARIVKSLGLVRGSAVRGAHLGKDILAYFRNLVGGEISEYTKMLAESREQALDRLIENAEKLGGNAVVSVKFSTSNISSGAAEVLIYGTAVVVEEAEAP